MGRKTFKTIPEPLSSVAEVVVTRDNNFTSTRVLVANSIDDALSILSNYPNVFVIGGSEIYKQTLPITSKIFKTLVHAHPVGKTFFFYDPAEWREIFSEKHYADQNNEYDYTYINLELIKNI